MNGYRFLKINKNMKIIVAGSRNIVDYDFVVKCIIDSSFKITELISGGCRGVDLLAEKWATQNNIIITRFNAKWNVYGKMAGPIRNSEMVNYADGLIAIWDGISRGTKNIIELAKNKNIPVVISIYK